MTVVLGVDGGGTKTAFCLLSEDAQVLGTATSPTMYPGVTAADPNAISDAIRDELNALCATVNILPSSISFTFLGVPGYGESPRADLAVHQAITETLHSGRFECANDMVCAWAGAFAGGDGVNVVSGTGSIAYAQKDGHSVRVGGWGPIMGDEGSAYWIGAEGLRATTQMMDGRQTPGLLLNLITTALDLRQPMDLIELVEHSWRGNRERIAAIAPVVTAAAEQDDLAAQDIVRRAAVSLAQLAFSAREQLHSHENDPIGLSWSGGVFDHPSLLRAFYERVSREPNYFRTQPPRLSPVAGAAVLAAQRAGHPFTTDAIARLAAQTTLTAGHPPSSAMPRPSSVPTPRAVAAQNNGP